MALETGPASTPPAASGWRRSVVPSAWTLLLLLLAGLVLRLPIVPLPLTGDGALLASRGEVMAAETAFDVPGSQHQGPLMAMLLVVPIELGASPTAALRFADVMLGALWAPLVWVVVGRLGAGPRARWWSAVLVLVHPAVLARAGGPTAGAVALEGALFLGGLAFVSSSRVGARRVAFALAALLPWAVPLAVSHAVPLAVVAVAREPRSRVRVALAVALVASILLAPSPSVEGDLAGASDRALGLLVVWLPVASLIVLLPGVPGGATRLARHSAVGGAWLVATVLALLLRTLLPVTPGFSFSADALGVGASDVPFVVAAGVRGLTAARTPILRRLVPFGLVLAVPAALAVVSGPLQVELAPGHPGPAGRRHVLGRAVREAGRVAGPGGWVAVDVEGDGLSAATARRLADLVDVAEIGRLEIPLDPARSAGPRLPLLPVEELAENRTIGLLTWREEPGPVTTLAGRGIYRLEPVRRFGRWVVARVTRP